ncbi:MAG: hypothetical protein Q7S84_02230 [bacterium]|nr:hypothetical protein [bacterium]
MIKGVFHDIFGLIAEFFQKPEAWWLVALLALTGAGSAFVLPDVFLMPVLLEVFRFLLRTWWLWAFFLLVPLTAGAWKHWRQELFKHSLEFVLLELHMPREVTKSPQAMEQVLQTFQSVRGDPDNIVEEFWDGKFVIPISLEVVSFGGEVHFYIRCQKKQQHMVKIALFSYYTDVEVRETEDYLGRLPTSDADMVARGWDFWGTELILLREEAYPIKTYDAFAREAEEEQFDPISVLLEVFGSLKGEEVAAVQLLVAPADPEWGTRWEPFLANLRKPATIEVASDDESKRQAPVARSPRQLEVLEAVEGNLSKPAFDTLIRCFYAAPVSLFNDAVVKSGIVGAFNQYTASDLNGFKSNSNAGVKANPWKWPHVRARRRTSYRRQRFFWNFLQREVPPATWWGKLVTSSPLNLNFASKRFLLTTKCVATLFHPPTAGVLTAPHIKRVESKKAGPPSGLAIFGEEGEIEHYV